MSRLTASRCALAVPVLLGLLLLCGGPADAAPTEIVFWNPLGGYIGEMVDKTVQEFSAGQSDVKVKSQYQGPSYASNQQKVQAGIVAGSVPDVTIFEISSLRQFAAAGALVDLSAMMKKNAIDIRDFIEGLLVDGEVGGKIYALPFNRSTPLLYYNKTLFKENNLDLAGPKTWDDLRRAAQVLTVRKGNEVERYGIKLPVHIWLYECMVAQAGGSVLNDQGTEVTANSPAGIKALKLWMDMVQKDRTQAATLGWGPARTDFVNGKTAMIFESTAQLAALLEQIGGRFELGAAFFPRDQKYAVATGGASLVIPSASKNIDAAFKFVAYVTSTQKNAEFSKLTGYLPARRSSIAAMDSFWAANPLFKVAVDQLEYAIPRPKSARYPEVSDLMLKLLERAVQGELTAEEALNRFKADGDKILSRR